MAPARILGPVIAGALIDRSGYAPALLAAVACAVVALAALPLTRPHPTEPELARSG
jgi:hypothetical protein